MSNKFIKLLIALTKGLGDSGGGSQQPEIQYPTISNSELRWGPKVMADVNNAALSITVSF